MSTLPDPDDYGICAFCRDDAIGELITITTWTGIPGRTRDTEEGVRGSTRTIFSPVCGMHRDLAIEGHLELRLP